MRLADASLHRLLYKVARAYYRDELTQQEVATRFGLSRPKVSRLLKQARELGIVRIGLVPPPGETPELEAALERRYGLREAAVVTASDVDDPLTVAAELAPVAAQRLLRVLDGDTLVAITWGRTMLAVVEALPAEAHPDVTIVQISGGLGPVGSLEHSTDLARRMAQRLGAQLALLPAPGIVSSQAAANALRGEPQIARTLRLAAEADVALVGLGVLAQDSVLLSSGTIITEEDVRALVEAGAVGDVALRYMGADGTAVDLSLNDRIIGLSLDEIRRIPLVIGVAGGRPKVEIIRAALKGDLLDVLITDQLTAERLLDAAR